MMRMSLPTTKTFGAATAALVLALAGSACSSEPGADGQRATAATETDGASSAVLATAEFAVEGMTCGGCALATEMAVKKLEGVRSADAEYDEATGEGRCTVEYESDRVTTDRIAAAIEKAGFTPTLKSTNEGG